MSFRVILTGGAGFIGSNMAQWIMEQQEIDQLVVLDCFTYAGHRKNLEPILNATNFSIEEVDLRDVKAVTRVVSEGNFDGVLHLAAESHVDRSISNPAAFVETNVLGTFHLLEACRQVWAGDWSNKRFIHVSTDEVFGSLGQEGLFSEGSNYSPNSPYSASKAGADHLVRAYQRTYGFPSIITNCSNNFGPYQHPEKLIPLTIHRAEKMQQIPVYGDGKNVRDWLHVNDHVRALWLVLKKGKVGDSYNIGGGNEWPNIKIVETICDLVDERLGRAKGTARGVIKFVKDRAGHDFRYAIDSKKIHEELSWQVRNTFAADLKQTVDWYLDNQNWMESVLKENG